MSAIGWPPIPPFPVIVRKWQTPFQHLSRPPLFTSKWFLAGSKKGSNVFSNKTNLSLFIVHKGINMSELFTKAGSPPLSVMVSIFLIPLPPLSLIVSIFRTTLPPLSVMVCTLHFANPPSSRWLLTFMNGPSVLISKIIVGEKGGFKHPLVCFKYIAMLKSYWLQKQAPAELEKDATPKS